MNSPDSKNHGYSPKDDQQHVWKDQSVERHVLIKSRAEYRWEHCQSKPQCPGNRLVRPTLLNGILSDDGHDRNDRYQESNQDTHHVNDNQSLGGLGAGLDREVDLPKESQDMHNPPEVDLKDQVLK